MTNRPNDLPEWADADRISDRIVDLANEEVQRGTSPLQIFAGEMLALMALMHTARGLPQPPEMAIVEKAIGLCLDSMIQGRKAQ